MSSKVSGLGVAAAEWLGKKEIVVKLGLGRSFCVFSTSPTHKADRRTQGIFPVWAGATGALAVLCRLTDWGLLSS